MYEGLDELLKTSNIQEFHTKRVNRKENQTGFRMQVHHNMSMFYDTFSNIISLNTCEPIMSSESELFVDYIFRPEEVKIIVDIRTEDDVTKARSIFTVRYDMTEEELFQLDTVQNTFGLTLDTIKIFDKIRYHYLEEL